MLDSTGIPNLPGYMPQAQNARRSRVSLDYQRGMSVVTTDENHPTANAQRARVNAAGAGSLGLAASMMFPGTLKAKVEAKPFTPQFVSMDNKCLSFKAFLKEDMPELPNDGFRIRKFNIFYFLLDHTIRVSEEREENSGLPQGGFLKRARVPLLAADGPASVPVGAASTSAVPADGFVTWEHIRIGQPLVVYGRALSVVDCDQFTRDFYAENKQPQQSNTAHMVPNDPYFMRRKAAEEKMSLKVPDDRRQRFIAFNRKVLRFYCQWDDRAAIYGERRPYILHFYLEDDTIEICEVRLPNDGRDQFSKLLRRQKLPVDTQSALQDIGSGPARFYTDANLRVGERISVFGRPFLIYDCDDFTRHHLSTKFGLDQIPDLTDRIRTPFVAMPEREVPPPMGIGSEEDSLASLNSLIPKPPRRDEAKLMNYAGKALRFLACMHEAPAPEDEGRKFILGYWLADDAISIFEPPAQNSGIVGGKFLERSVRNNPDTGKKFTFKDFFIGAIIKVNCYNFKILDVDNFSKKFIETDGKSMRSSLYTASPTQIMQNLQKRYEEAKEALRAAFHVMDEDRSGNITHEEFIESLTLLHYDIEMKDAEPLLIWFDPDWKGYISYADFCDAIIRAAKFPAFLKEYTLEKGIQNGKSSPLRAMKTTSPVQRSGSGQALSIGSQGGGSRPGTQGPRDKS